MKASLIHWTPTKVSAVSVLVMGLVVIGIGLSGMSYVINSLYKGMVEHGLVHNHEVAHRMEPLLIPRIALSDDESGQLFRRVVQLYGSFGYRIFLVDDQGRLIADSQARQPLPRPLSETWLGKAIGNDNQTNGSGILPGSMTISADNGRQMLVSLHAITVPHLSNRRFLLGVGSDQENLEGFVDDLHRNLDGILIITYAAIGLIGVLGMRAVGRIYERRLEAVLEKRTRELEDAHARMVEQTRLATIGQTASVLAHEMRNPLSSIKLALSGLGATEGLPERAMRRIELVMGEVDRLDGLLSQTLDYARPLQFSDHPVDMDELVSHVVEQQQPLLEQKGLAIERRRCVGCGQVRVDEDKMVQVLLNVLKNAIEASPPGGGIRIEMISTGEGRLSLDVTNQGELPDEEVLAKAFEPFYTTKPRGSGLGLGLVKRIIEDHGGEVYLEVDEHAAITLHIELPLEN